jgi:hypothetical protein
MSLAELDVDVTISRLAAKAAEGVSDPREVDVADCLPLLRRVRRSELERIAAGVIAETARSLVRSANLGAERRAEEEARRANLYMGKWEHGSWNRRKSAVYHGCTCPACERTRASLVEDDAARREGDRKLFARISSIVDDFAANLRIEWTAELLATSFAIDNSGETVTWAAATVEQHERRIAMLEANVAGNIEAAARHRKAVVDIGALRCRTLGEAVQLEAVAS